MYSIREQGTEAVYRDRLEDVEISVEQGLCLGLAGFEEPPAVSWPEDFRAAFAAPLGTPMLRDLARGKRRVAVIVSDSTRGVPTAKVMPMVLEELADAGIRSKDITVVVARGVHRPATEDEIRDIVGEESLKGLTVINHDPYGARLLVSLGKTSFGTPVEVSRAVYEADLRISIGKVEPHEFAGFSGGRKSVLPGIASERTIEINHRPDMLMSPEARPGELSKNPIHLDMVEAAGMLKIHFTVNLVVNQAGETIGVFAGGIEEAHAAAVGFMRSFCQITLKEQPDIIVTTPGKPLNINFYQSVKPLIALAPVMAPGGVLVLYCSCRDGLGTEDMLIPYEGAQTVDDVIGRLNAEYKIQMDHALLLGKILRKGIRIVVATPSVDEAVLRKMFLDTASSPQEALKKAMNMVPNPKPKVLFFPQPQRALSVLDQVSAR
ncbi:MAG TPA: nickel-dependent lactate racemase [Deltaproteobacteria bacterium]|nr:nickel-dependent lactate racemase [Deltaproteobacteria bacterium]